MAKICMDPEHKDYTPKCDDTIVDLWDQLYEEKGQKKNHQRLLYVLRIYSFDKTFKNYVDTDEWECYKTDPNILDESKCCCSHLIHDKYYIRSKFNGNILRVGNVCVGQVFENHQKIINEVKSMQLQHNYQKNGGNKRVCMSCGKHKIDQDEPSYKTVCKSCFKNGNKDVVNIQILDGKECSKCHKRVIPKDDWRTICKNCYTSIPMKKCEGCAKMIPNEASWKKLCAGCYKLK